MVSFAVDIALNYVKTFQEHRLIDICRVVVKFIIIYIYKKTQFSFKRLGSKHCFIIHNNTRGGRYLEGSWTVSGRWESRLQPILIECGPNTNTVYSHQLPRSIVFVCVHWWRFGQFYCLSCLSHLVLCKYFCRQKALNQR